jgi:sterol desaturase/sphingolipid hydroxylase (fatty acid hydroxylase superfamily)
LLRFLDPRSQSPKHGRGSRAAKYVPTEEQDRNARDSRRERLLTPTFSLPRQLGVLAALGATGAAVAAALARRARPADLWIVPAYLVVANVVEYLMHRLFMHRPLWPRTFYRSHTLGHHRAFHNDSMEVSSWRELELVMMPWFSLALFLSGIGPVVALVAWGLGRGPAGLVLLTGVFSFVLYEGLHALYHFPIPVLRRLRLFDNRAFGFLYRHHRHHHRLVRMRWMNFNISLPLSDRLFGTLETEAAWQAEHDRRRSARALAAEATAKAHARPPANDTEQGGSDADAGAGAGGGGGRGARSTG